MEKISIARFVDGWSGDPHGMWILKNIAKKLNNVENNILDFSPGLNEGIKNSIIDKIDAIKDTKYNAFSKELLNKKALMYAGLGGAAILAGLGISKLLKKNKKESHADIFRKHFEVKL